MASCSLLELELNTAPPALLPVPGICLWTKDQTPGTAKRATLPEYLRCPSSHSSNKGERKIKDKEELQKFNCQIYYRSACCMFKS